MTLLLILIIISLFIISTLILSFILLNTSKIMISDDFQFQRDKYLLVIAHPDDESMFFVPTIENLLEKGCEIFILCLTCGNANGFGIKRMKELYSLTRYLHIPNNRIKIVDDHNLPVLIYINE